MMMLLDFLTQLIMFLIWLELPNEYRDMLREKHAENIEKILNNDELQSGLKGLIVYSQIYLFLKLALMLHVAVAIMEITFSAINFIKTKLSNYMYNQLMNDCLVAYTEMDLMVLLIILLYIIFKI